MRKCEECEREDKKMCQMSSIMHTLSAISRASPVCRKSALFAMLQSQRKYNFDIEFVKKVGHTSLAALYFSDEDRGFGL